MKSVAIIQARMGSSRLPGKMMLSLGEEVALTHVINRVVQAEEVDEVIVATSEKDQDSVIAEQARQSGVSAYRGDEHDVLGRMYNAATDADADFVIRIAGDCVFVSPEVINHMLEKVQNSNVEYMSNKLIRTFPLGLDVEVFSKGSFETVKNNATEPHEREHVTAYYLENTDEFSVNNVSSEEIFDKERYQDRTDIELVLDEAADYFYLDKIYSSLPSGKRDIRSVIDYIDREDLTSEIVEVARKTKEDIEQDEIGKQTDDST